MEKEKNPVIGRDAVIEAYRSVNPELGEEIDDTALWDFSNGRYSELEEKYNTLNGSNQKLAKLIATNPQLADTYFGAIYKSNACTFTKTDNIQE